jgi:hypothetical protein
MKSMFIALAILTISIAGAFTVAGFHTVDIGQYYVVKSFNGDTSIEDKPGWFFNYGTETPYPNFLSMDFTGNPTASASLVLSPFSVKYAEGGTGTIEGNVQIQMPTDYESRMKIHTKFGSKEGFMSSLIRNTTGEALTFTAGLMESQEAYMTHRAQFRTAAKDQLLGGLYATQMVKTTRVDAKGDNITTTTAAPKVEDGKFIRQDQSPLAQYGVTLTQFNIQDWNFEPATMSRIAEKRDAENKVITSRARTETAEQDKKEAEAIADKNKAIAEGEAQALAVVQVVNANRDKALAEIVAAQHVAVALALADQRENELKAKTLEAQGIDVISKAEAAAADRKIKAGGTLSAEQQTRIEIAQVIAKGYADAKRPTTVVVSGGESASGELTGTSMDAFMQTMTAASAKNMIGN